MPLTSDEFVWTGPDGQRSDVRVFTDSYETFTRVLNNLQRQYLELKDEFAQQTDQADQLNSSLLRLSAENSRIHQTLHSILQAVSFGIIAIDAAGVISHCNPAAARLLNLPARGVIGERYRDVIDPGTPAEVNALRALERGEAIEPTDRRLTRMNGTIGEFVISVTLLSGSDGKPAGAVEVWQDVSQIRTMEREIARLHTLAAMGQMAGTIAHQVRNPLAAIGGFASLLKRDMAPDDPRQRLVDNITRGTQRLNETVTALLNFARQEELQREVISLVSLLEECVHQLKIDLPETTATISLQQNIPEQLRTTGISVDHLLFRQVLMNLLANAAEACQPQGRIVIAARTLTATDKAVERTRIPASADETLLAITITDSGPGFSAEALHQLFLPFFTTKRDGTGLGLAMAAKIVKAHGGDLSGTNAPPLGAELTILLPIRHPHSVVQTKGLDR